MPTQSGLYGPGQVSYGGVPGWWAEQFQALTFLVELLQAAVDAAGAGVAEEAAARAAADALLIPLTQKAAANGVATLGPDSKIPGAQLPSLAIGEVLTADGQAAMLALTAQRGDVAVRTDLNPDGFFLLTSDSPGTLADWVQVTAPGAVVSVNGQTGAVDLSGTFVETPDGSPITAGSIVTAEAATGSQAAQRFLLKLRQGVSASMLVLGDSTGNEATEWVYLTAVALAARYPALTVRYRLWNDGGAVYDAPTTIAAGSGAGVLDIYNCSVAGKNTDYYLLPNFATMVPATAPDLVFISQGHNESPAGGLNSQDFRERLLALAETVAAAVNADLILIAQNPQAVDQEQQARAVEVAQVASLRGYGFVNVYQAFMDTGNITPLLLGDGVHPSVTGSALWSAEVLKALVYTHGVNPRTRQRSSLLSPGEGLFANTDFAEFSGSLPGSWTGSNVTATKNLTTFESPNAYAVRLVPTTAAAASMYQDCPYLPMVKGQWVTVAVRQFIPLGVPTTSGRINLQIIGGTGATSLTSRATGALGGWRWAVLSIFVPTDATTLRCRIYADTAATGTGDVTIDRVVFVRGILPAGALGAGGPPGVAGPTGPAPNARPLHSGRYYLSSKGPAAPSIMQASRFYMVPWDVEVATTIDRIAVYVTTAGGTGSVVRICMYPDDGTNAPDLSAGIDFGTVATETPNSFAQITINQAVGVGRHWLAAQSQGGPSPHPTIYMTGSAAADPTIGMVSAAILLSPGYYVSYGGATFPSSGALVDQIPVPLFKVRAA